MGQGRGLKCQKGTLARVLGVHPAVSYPRTWACGPVWPRTRACRACIAYSTLVSLGAPSGNVGPGEVHLAVM